MFLSDHLFRREIGSPRHSTSPGLYGHSHVPSLYSHSSWVDNLDVVNELGGHIGCVNTLSWAKSGRLLASGSDDQYLNIHSYQPSTSSVPFTLSTSISTGHTANIFSTKFMPHSDDRTLVTCAGDGEVRVFDIEYSGRSHIPADPRSSVARYLSPGDTKCRVYRSHSDRVKRIVTESSPHLFLTCSEDGEVRQWDLRQPSNYYPSPRGGRGFLASRSRHGHDDSNVPPPLISYKKQRLDLNTISCSPSQPHYIALGGAHLHCFLHDRRMLATADSSGSRGDRDLDKATRCVRRFAPNGARRMKRRDNGHITACKISDANPNEMVVSWSGDNIYKFNLIQPDAGNAGDPPTQTVQRKGKSERKRKRKAHSTSVDDRAKQRSLGEGNGDGEGEGGGGGLALRVRYENGQSEEFSIDPDTTDPEAAGTEISEAREALLTPGQREANRLARTVGDIRREFFGLESSRATPNPDSSITVSSPTPHTASYSHSLGFASICLPAMDGVMRTWSYPVSPHDEEIILHRTLRHNRDAARRFVQAAGCISRVLGGRLRTPPDPDPDPDDQGARDPLDQFSIPRPAPNEGRELSHRTRFLYDLITAIVAWVDGGMENVLHVFRAGGRRQRGFTLSQDAGIDAIEGELIPYLVSSASSDPVPNVDASRFERDELQVVFESEVAAVTAFARAIRLPRDASTNGGSTTAGDTHESNASGDTHESTVSRPSHALGTTAAVRFWVQKVCRGLLMTAGEGVNFSFISRAFGGVGSRGTENDEDRPRNVDVEEDEEMVDSVRLVRTVHPGSTDHPDHPEQPPSYESATAANEPHPDPDPEANDAYETDDDSSASDSGSGYGDDDPDGDAEERPFSWSSAFNSSHQRGKVESHVPCAPHTTTYAGHCNVRTVKDVNFFGMQDEYVVSGSDSGHVFVWENRTGKLVNILQGDSDVVNVVQAHPYEPMLAVSGIDETIKIFSPDQKAQTDARRGINVSSTLTGTGLGSFPSTRPVFARRPHRTSSPSPSPDPPHDKDAPPGEAPAIPPGGLASRKRMHQSYEITSQNDVERRGGNRDAWITRDTLAQVAAFLRERRGAGGGTGGEGGGGGAGGLGVPLLNLVGDPEAEGEEMGGVMMDDNCNVM